MYCCASCGGIGCRGNRDNEYVAANNISSFAGCTVIQGAIKILQTTLSGYVMLILRSLSANVDDAAVCRRRCQ